MDEILSANQPQMDRVCDKVKKLLIKKQKLKQDAVIEVTPHLFLGNYCNAIDKKLLQSKQIKLVVSCLKVEDRDRCQQIQYLQLLAKDQPDEKIQKYFDQLYQKLSAYLDAGKACLVNCFSAKSRSPTLVLSYLIRKNSMDYQSAYNFLKQKASNIQPNKGFVSQLKQYSSQYKKEQKVADIQQQRPQDGNVGIDVNQQVKQSVNMNMNSENELVKEWKQKQQKLQQQKIEISQIQQQQVQEDNDEKQDLPKNSEEKERSNQQQQQQWKQQNRMKGQEVVENQTNRQNSQIKQQLSNHSNLISSPHIEEVDQNQNTATQQPTHNIAQLQMVTSDIVEPPTANQKQSIQQQNAVGKPIQQNQLAQVNAKESIAVEVEQSTEEALNIPTGAQQTQQQKKDQDLKRQVIIAEQKVKQENKLEVEHEGNNDKQEQHLVEGEGEVRKKKKKKKKNK